MLRGQLFGWNVRKLAAALAPFMDKVQPLLLFDVGKQHIYLFVFKACATTRILPVVVPSRTTWLLQPLGTHVFAMYDATSCVRTRRSVSGGRVGLWAWLF